MKKALKLFSYLLLFTISIVVVTGCFDKKIDSTNNTDNDIKINTDKEVTFGEWDDNIYTNEFLGIKYTMPDGWSKYSDEEIAEVMNIAVDDLKKKDEIKKLLDQQRGVFYVMASDSSTGNNIILLSEKPLLKDASMSLYTNSLKQQLALNTNLIYTVEEPQEETINNFNYTTMKATTSQNGVQIYQKYFIRKVDNNFVSVIVSSTNDKQLDEIIKDFEKLN